MKKRVSTLFAVAALVGAASAFAANPFSDVPKDSWAYQAVTQLAAEGVVTGYPDGTFQGEKNITRYEMAAIIARAMAKEDRANAEQRAIINQLAQEFAAELNNLGVRVAGLENRVGNVKLTGDARIKFKHTGAHTENKQLKEATGSWKARFRLNANAMVGENTTAGARLKMETEFGGPTGKNVEFDRLWVNHNFGGVAVTAGRQGAMLGEGLTLDTTLDGAVAVAPVGNATLVAGYGYPVSATGYNSLFKTATFGQVNYDVMGVGFKAYYLKINDRAKELGNVDGFYGVSASTKVGAFGLTGEWTRAKHSEKSNAWVVGVDYQAGPANLMLQYFHEQEHALLPDTTFDQVYSKNWKGFVASADVALAKNVNAQFVYSFKGKHVDATENSDLTNTYYAQLNYKF